MGIVLHYLRGPEPALRNLLTTPEKVLDANSHPAEIKMIDLDRDWETLSALLSERKRAEMAHLDWLLEDSDRSDEEMIAAAAAVDRVPVDDALIAIEGRLGEHFELFEEIGCTAILAPAAGMPALQRGISAVPVETLRVWDDPASIDRYVLGGWREGDGDLVDDHLLPLLKQLEGFYATAVTHGEAVLFVYC